MYKNVCNSSNITICLHLACLTLILKKTHKQNSKFVIQNNDNQKKASTIKWRTAKNDRENNKKTTEMDELLEKKLCKISIMRLFCFKSKNKNATNFGWIASTCSFHLSRFPLFCFRLHFCGVWQYEFVLSFRFFRFCSHLFEIIWNNMQQQRQHQQQQHEAWHCDIRLAKERERKNRFFPCLQFIQTFPVQLLESDGNLLTLNVRTNAHRTAAHYTHLHRTFNANFIAFFLISFLFSSIFPVFCTHQQ